MIDWCQDIGRTLNVVVVILKSEKGTIGKKGRLILGCERGGSYRQNKFKKDKNEKGARETGTKKCKCPFRMKGIPLNDGKWGLEVVCGVHNHELSRTLVGHSYAGRLRKQEQEIVADMTKSGVSANDILITLKRRDKTNVTCRKTIYNVRARYRLLDMQGRTCLQ